MSLLLVAVTILSVMAVFRNALLTCWFCTVAAYHRGVVQCSMPCYAKAAADGLLSQALSAMHFWLCVLNVLCGIMH